MNKVAEKKVYEWLRNHIKMCSKLLVTSKQQIRIKMR